MFSIDGMRPDALSPERTPFIWSLLETGAWTLSARTVMPSVTLPCHTSMLRGVDVPRHGITSNVFTPLARPVPSLLDVARANGRRTGFFYNWGELRDLCAPGSLDVGCFVQDAHRAAGDARVADLAVAEMAALDFCFVYLGYTDEQGHMTGWMSPEYLDAIAHADRCVGQVVTAARASGRPITALVLSDHGGHGQSHGTEMDEDMTIPWILCGDGVRSGEIAGPVRIFDTCVTLAALLDLPMAREWEGRVVSEALL